MATLTIYPDFECKIFIDTELHGIASANSEYEITLEQGVYWVECRSTEQPSLSYDFDYKATSSQEQTCIEVVMLPEIRLQELKTKYDFIGEFKYGFAEVRNKGELIGYIDENYTFCYDEITEMCDNVLRVCSIGKYGLINYSKEEIVPIKYDEIELLGDAALRLKLNNRYGLLDCQGTKITALKYLSIEDAKNDTFALYFDKWIFMDIKGIEKTIPDNVILYTVNDEKAVKYKTDRGDEEISHIFIETKGTGLIIGNDIITEIGGRAFCDCESLTSITIPDSVTEIERDAFSGCKGLINITIPDSVTEIGENAFDGCKSLTSITIPDSVTKIGGRAFCYCESLTSITIPDSVTSIGDRTFLSCSSLTSVTIPNGVTSIGDNLFYGCKSLTNITIPDGVTKIGEGAFEECENLLSITMPNSITSIGMCAFGRNLKEFKGDFASEDGRCIIINNELKAFAPAGLISYTIPNGVTSVGDRVFFRCNNLESITIPDSIVSIGVEVFAQCDNLKEFKGDFISEDGRCIIINGELAAFAPAGLDAYTTPEGVKSIGHDAFSCCTELENVIISDGVTTIGCCAFSESSIRSITIPNSVVPIESGAFSYCMSLKKITIPNSVTKIGSQAFMGCSYLEGNLIIPESVIEIDYDTLLMGPLIY